MTFTFFGLTFFLKIVIPKFLSTRSYFIKKVFKSGNEKSIFLCIREMEKNI